MISMELKVSMFIEEVVIHALNASHMLVDFIKWERITLLSITIASATQFICKFKIMGVYTSKIENRAKKFKLTVEEYYFVVLASCGENVDDAWNATVRRGITWTKSARKDEIDRVLNSEGAVRLKDELNPSADGEDYMNYDLTDKEQVIKALTQLSRKNMKPNEAAAIITRIADLQMMKKDEVKAEDETIHYYIPLTCFKCPLKKKYDKEVEKKENKSIEE